MESNLDVIAEILQRPVLEVQKSALGWSQRRPVDLKSLALVSQPAEQGLGQLFIAEHGGP